MNRQAVVMVGAAGAGGTYLLRIAVRQDSLVAFGRYAQGRALSVPAGEYVYVGSAAGRRGSATLARRVLRHAQRTGDRPPQDLLPALQRVLAGLGTGPAAPARSTKRLRWHIDYLLDEPAVQLAQVYLLCGPRRLESAVAAMLLADAHTSILAKGLGSSDMPGQTHLLRVQGGDGWWRDLGQRLAALWAEEHPAQEDNCAGEAAEK